MIDFLGRLFNKKEESTDTADSSPSVARISSFDRQSPEKKEEILRQGAKSFSRDFTRTIEQLANE
jgi:hypothetical protein